MSDFADWLLNVVYPAVEAADAVADYPLQILVYAEPLGSRVLMADLGNQAFEAKYPPLTLEERAAGKKRGEKP